MPAKFDGRESLLDEAARMRCSLRKRLTERMARIGAHAVTPRSTDKRMNGLHLGLALDVPKRDVDRRHGVAGDAVAAEVQGCGGHALPGRWRISGIGSGEYVGKAAHH